jgi:hypothetical protein
MGEYVSPIDGHRHFGDAGRAECAVCCLEAERDRLRAVVEDITAHASPIAEDDDGFVAVGYTITIGAIWDPSTGDAVFDSTRARAIGDRLLAEIRARIVGDRSDELREQRDTARSQRAALAQRCERLDERRHELHDLLTVVETERDRLRSVVDIVRDAFLRPSDDEWKIDSGALVVLADALNALDGSAEATDG